MALGKNLDKDSLLSDKSNGKAKRAAEANAKDKGNIDFLQVMEGSDFSIIILDAKETITFFNESAEKLWGYTRKEVIGENAELLMPRDVHLLEGNQSEKKKRAKNNVKEDKPNLKALTKAGKEVDILVSISESVTDGETYYTAFIQDITEQKKIQSELETRMAQVNLACIVSESDLKGNIISVNDKLCEVSQFTREECIGQPHSMFRHPDMPKETFKELWSTIGRGGIFRGVIKNRKKMVALIM